MRLQVRWIFNMSSRRTQPAFFREKQLWDYGVVVPEAGIEPARPLRKQQILSLVCLPISPLGHGLEVEARPRVELG